MDKLLHAAFFTPMGEHPTEAGEDWGARICLWGPPGGGKTSAMKRTAAQAGARFLAFDSTVGEGALGVCPTPDMDAGCLRFMPPDFLVESFPAGEAGLLLCDDATTFAPSLQQPLLGLLLNKRLGFHHFGPRVRVMMAANEPLDAPGGWDLAPAVANRICHVEFPDSDVDEWCRWLIGGANGAKRLSPAACVAEEKRVLSEWSAAFAKASGLMAGFSLAFRNLHRVQPDANNPQASKAWCSPRTKEMATRALASAFVHGLSEDATMTFVAGYVGQAFASEFVIWQSQQDIPDAAEFLVGAATFEHSNYRIDRTAALLASCVALIASQDKNARKLLVPPFYKFLESVSEDAADAVAEVVVGSMHKLGLVRGVPEARGVLKRLRPVLEAVEASK